MTNLITNDTYKKRIKIGADGRVFCFGNGNTGINNTLSLWDISFPASSIHG